MAYNTDTTGQAARAARSTTITGSFGSPIIVTAVGGVTPGGFSDEIMFVKSDTGQFLIVADPQIAVGTVVGQTITFIGTDDTDAFAFGDGTGVFAGNAAFSVIAANCVLTLTWTGMVWANMTNASVIDTIP